jgi:hypothetical protein
MPEGDGVTCSNVASKSCCPISMIVMRVPLCSSWYCLLVSWGHSGYSNYGVSTMGVPHPLNGAMVLYLYAWKNRSLLPPRFRSEWTQVLRLCFQSAQSLANAGAALVDIGMWFCALATHKGADGQSKPDPVAWLLCYSDS